MDKVTEEECHGRLESGSRILRPNGITRYANVPQGVVKRSLVLVFFLDLNLVITRKTIHERKDFVADTCINDLINEQSGEVVFGACQIQVTKFSTDASGGM